MDDLDIELMEKHIKEHLKCSTAGLNQGQCHTANNIILLKMKIIFLRGFPADFIAEGLDQTRGWFYTLTVLAVALFYSLLSKTVSQLA
ncbi:MAG: hypothetical protein Ct9H90mP22_2210 [Gammaproteobacteria bacterium]|nr:MAG: hypothetical protein Ct9H90mP22_2210 [Gammaproteobacteria bacterium]